MIQGDENKVHLDVQFTRYREDGSVLGTYKSLWIVSKWMANGACRPAQATRHDAYLKDIAII